MNEQQTDEATDEALLIAAAELEGWTITVDHEAKLNFCSHPTMHGLPANYLTSTDAALRLVERLDPNMHFNAERLFTGGWRAVVGRSVEETGPCLARCITLACLRAAGKLP